MPDAPSSRSSTAFAHDLRRLREDAGLSLEALHDETKIPLGLLQQFEETGLFDHPMFNRVYLRSLVRTYAERIGIASDDALAALEAALAGTYQGELVHPAAPVEEAPIEPETPGSSDDVDRPETPEPEAPGVPSVPVAPSTSEAPATPEVPATAPPPQGPGEAEKGDSTTEAEEKPGARKEAPLVVQTVERSTEWDAASPPPPVERSRPIDVKRRASFTQWTLVVGSMVVLIAAIWAAIALIQRPQTELEPVPVAEDTTEAVADTAVVPERLSIPLGDTMNVVVLAANGPVEGLRVTRDDDLRRPYWIEQGDYRSFPSLRRVVLEYPSRQPESVDRAFGAIQVLVEGYAFPMNLRDEQGRLVVTRDAARAFLDTVTTAPVALPDR